LSPKFGGKVQDKKCNWNFSTELLMRFQG